MPPSTLTPDEWLALQSAPLWMQILAAPTSKTYYDSNAILEQSMFMLEYAEKNAKEKVVFELLFAMRTDSEKAIKKFKADSRLPEVVLQEVFSILNTKLSLKEADEIRKIYQWYLENYIVDDNISRLVTLADKMASPRTSTVPPSSSSSSSPPASGKKTPMTPPPKVPPPPTSKRLPIYLLVDSSRHISDSASFLDSGINNRLGNHLRTRPKRSVPLTLGFIAINDVSDLAVPLTEPAAFHAPSLVGAGACQFGRALLSLHVDLANQLSDSKPLVFIFLAGAPNDAWQKPAKQIQDLAKNGKINVIAIGSGALADLACLKEVGAAQPMIMSGITQSNVDQVFDWLYGIIDVIMSGLESGASGKQSVPNPPACLKSIP